MTENRKLTQASAQKSKGQPKKQSANNQQKADNKAPSQQAKAKGAAKDGAKKAPQAEDLNLSQEDKVKLIVANRNKIKEQAKKNRREAGIEDSDDDEEPERTSIFDYDVDIVEIRKAEMLKKYPWAAAQIEQALTDSKKMRRIKKGRAEQLVNADKFLAACSKRTQNMSFEEQRRLRKVLVEAADGDDTATEYESDPESIGTGEKKPSYDQRQAKQTQKMEQKERGLFKYLTVLDKKVFLPPMKPSYKDTPHGGLTLFLELDDTILHTFICDENTGYIAKPSFKEPEHEFMLNEVRLPILVYERDHMDDFLKYLVDAKSEVETVVFTRAERIYVDALLKIIDPERKVFDHVLSQNACYRLLKEDDDVDHFLKDISRFKNRKMARSVLADPDTLNFALTPENGLPIMSYKGENFQEDGTKDGYLLSVIEEIEELRKMEDVRPYLEQQYGHRQLLRNAKLI